MSANLLPKAPTTIKQWLTEATKQLKDANISSARLDVLILLEDELGKDRGWILAHHDEVIVAEKLRSLNKKLAQRTKRTPLAYIRGFVEFYGHKFEATPDVLIPRPETEELIELALQLNLPKTARVIDVGTGSGAIAITLKCERPDWQITATDISEKALAVARQNATALGAQLNFLQANLLRSQNSDLRTQNLIVANLPYVAEGFEVSPDARAEPALALYANDAGYGLIERLLPQATSCLLPGGYLILESDPWQQERIIKAAQNHGFTLQTSRRFHVVLRKK